MLEERPRPTPQSIPARIWGIAAVTGAGAFLAMIDSTLVNLALESIRTDLDTTLGLVQWTVTAYLGVNIPNFGPTATPSEMLRWAQFAEENGFAAAMMSDHVAPTPDVIAQYPAPFYDAFTALSWLGGLTDRLELGTTVAVLPTSDRPDGRQHRPVHRRTVHSRRWDRLVGVRVRGARCAVPRTRTHHRRISARHQRGVDER